MNPRIQELIAKANGTPVELVEITSWTFAERLAELVVRECAEIADTLPRPSGVGCGYITYTTGQRIKKQLGVES